MAVTTARTRGADPRQADDPFAPDGTWDAEWPPEVWMTRWRLRYLGYRKISSARCASMTRQAHRLYVTRYGHEPPRRVLHRDTPTVVFEHARVEVVDETALSILGTP